jgi:hypothetical protein
MARGGYTDAGCKCPQFRRVLIRKKPRELCCRTAIFRTRDCNFKVACSEGSPDAKSMFSCRNTMEQSVHSGLPATAPQEAALASTSHSDSIRPPPPFGSLCISSHTGTKRIPLRSRRYAFFSHGAAECPPSFPLPRVLFVPPDWLVGADLTWSLILEHEGCDRGADDVVTGPLDRDAVAPLPQGEQVAEVTRTWVLGLPARQ